MKTEKESKDAKKLKEDIKKSLDVLRRFQAWRRYGGIVDGPDKPTQQEIGEALDVAITMLNSLVNKPNKEYYGG